MKQYMIIKACKSMDKILETDIPFSVKNDVFKFRKNFQQEWDFQLEQEKILESKLETNDIDGETRFTEESVKEYYKKIEELGNTYVEVSFKPLKICITEDTEKALGILKKDDFFNLDGFIEFE